MKRIFATLLVVLFGLHLGVSAYAMTDMEDRAEFLANLARERGVAYSMVAAPYQIAKAKLAKAMSAERQEVAAKLAAAVRARMGEQWVQPALQIGKVESGYNPRAVGPKTRHGHALGVGQLLLSSAAALGYRGDARGLLDADTNIEYTIRHMEKCIQAGVTTAHDMAGCHVAGWANYRSRSRYARAYRVMVAQAMIPAVPDGNGWLARGTTRVAALN